MFDEVNGKDEFTLYRWEHQKFRKKPEKNQKHIILSEQANGILSEETSKGLRYFLWDKTSLFSL
jgi:hypothetical protein